MYGFRSGTFALAPTESTESTDTLVHVAKVCESFHPLDLAHVDEVFDQARFKILSLNKCFEDF